MSPLFRELRDALVAGFALLCMVAFATYVAMQVGRLFGSVWGYATILVTVPVGLLALLLIWGAIYSCMKRGKR